MNTQSSLGVRAGCQLWERFFSLSGGGDLVSPLRLCRRVIKAERIQEFLMYKRSLISQGRSFCTGTAPQCREKIAALATDFLSDDVTVRTETYKRVVGHS
jgi:translation initiation factor eIF-2B subunit alpha